MLSSDFHGKENDGTTGAAHLIQKNQTPVFRQAPYSPDIAKSSSLLYIHM